MNAVRRKRSGRSGFGQTSFLRWPKVANHNSKFNQQQKQIRNQQKQIKNQQKQTKNQQKQMNYQQQKQMRSRKNSIMNLFLLLARLLLLLLGSTSNKSNWGTWMPPVSLGRWRAWTATSTTPNQHSLKVLLIIPDFSDFVYYIREDLHVGMVIVHFGDSALCSVYIV